MARRRPGARRRAARHLQARRRGPVRHPPRSAFAARRCRRSARSRTSPSCRAPRGAADGARDRRRSRRQEARAAGGGQPRHARRGARPVLGDAGAAQVPEVASAPRTMAVSEIVKRLAMAHPAVGFSLTTGERAGLRCRRSRCRPRRAAAAPRPHHGPRVPGRRAAGRRRARGRARDRALPACRRCTGPTPPSSSCSSTAAR